MFFIGLASGALLMFVLMVIYSSLAVAARADRDFLEEDWRKYYQDSFISEE